MKNIELKSKTEHYEVSIDLDKTYIVKISKTINTDSESSFVASDVFVKNEEIEISEELKSILRTTGIKELKK